MSVRVLCYHANAMFCTARQLSTDLGKSGDLLQTGEFTSGDKVTHFCCDSFQCSRMSCTVAHLFLLVSSISAHRSGDYFDVVSENTPSWHGLCLSCMVIASALILLLS